MLDATRRANPSPPANITEQGAGVTAGDVLDQLERLGIKTRDEEIEGPDTNRAKQAQDAKGRTGRLSEDTERVFFDNVGMGVRVTNSRFIVADRTYAMSGITSVKSATKTPSRNGPIVLGIFGICGILIAVLGPENYAMLGFGAVLIFLAVIWWVMQKTHYTVLLASASGETEALTDINAEFIKGVVQALNEAIIFRR